MPQDTVQTAEAHAAVREQAAQVRKRPFAQNLPTNPFVDVAMMLFLEDISEKQGVEGLLTYMMSQGSALAESMPPEDYAAWEDFVQAVNEGRSIFSALEGTEHFAGYCFVTPVKPFHEAIATYISLMGELLKAHQGATDYYNGTVQNSAVESMDVIHQSFRRELVKRISVAGRAVRYAELGTKGYNGEVKMAPESWLEVLLEKGQLSLTQLQMAVRQNTSVIIIYPPEREAARGAEAAVLAPKVLGAETGTGLAQELAGESEVSPTPDAALKQPGDGDKEKAKSAAHAGRD